jgi:hypothetical protein
LQTEGVQARSVEDAIAVLRYLFTNIIMLFWPSLVCIYIYFFIYLVSPICL